MIFLDTNVFLFAAGAEHPLRENSQRILRRVAQEELATSMESGRFIASPSQKPARL